MYYVVDILMYYKQTNSYTTAGRHPTCITVYEVSLLGCTGIQVTEQTGLIITIGKQVLLRQVRRFHNK